MNLDIQIHNNLFIATFKNKQVIRDFLNAVLDGPKLALLDLREMTIQDKSFVNDELRESVADLVVDVKIKESEDSAHVCFLFEHKSHPEKQIHRQLLRYITNIHEEDYKNGGLPRPVVPIVFYHGEEPWNTPSRYSDFLHYSEEYKKQCLDFEYTLFDVKNFDKKRDAKKFHNNLALLWTLAVFKDAKSMGYQECYEMAVEIKRSGEQIDITLVARWLTYLTCTTDGAVDKKQAKAIVNDVFDKQEVEKMKSFFGDEYYYKGMEEGEARGREEGRAEGEAKGEAKGREEGRTKGMIEKAIEMAKNSLKEGLSADLVARITQLPLEQILELQKEL